MAILITAATLWCQTGITVQADGDNRKLVDGNNAFAFELYGRLGRGAGNRFVSPISISTALAMTFAGARGETAAQIARTLHFTLPADELDQAFRQFFRALDSRNQAAPPGEPGAVELLLANAIWWQVGEGLLPDFEQRIAANFGGGVFPVDFRSNGDQARQTINHWVETRTHGKIADLLKPDHVSARTRLILTNAIYFKAPWASPFAIEKTRPADFHVSKDEQIRVEMMNQTGRFHYCDDPSVQVVELPYTGGGLSLLVILPRERDGLARLESELSPQKIESWQSKLTAARVEVSLPRFTVSEAVDLKDVLSELGMPMAFDPATADFSAMTGRRDLAISAVVHKAFVDVTEAGTEAAAATAVAAFRSALVAAPAVSFRADHPFLFAIRDQSSGAILFLGRLARP